MKKKSLLIAVAAIVLAVVSACSVTLAWLTATSGDVTNTFTVGKIEIELKEHEFVDGELTDTEVVANDTYKVVPGSTEDKDPFVRVKSGSEPCYVYVSVDNKLVIDSTVVGTPNIDTANWTVVSSSGTKTLYRYNTKVDASEATQVIPVFTKVTYAGEAITTANIGQLADKTIVINAYAHQSENLTDGQTTADTAAIAWAFPSNQ